MDRVQGHNEHALRTAVAGYIHDLCDHKPIWLGGDWNRNANVYKDTFFRIIQRYCNACQLNNNVCEIRIDVPHHPQSANYPFLQQLVENNVHLPNQVTSCLNSNNTNIRAVWVWLNFQWVRANGTRGGHAALLVFDRFRKKQIVFDPDWYYDRNMLPNVLCEHQFHPRYDLIPVNQSTWATGDTNLQRSVQEIMHVDETGVCGILSLLVMLCCMRFDYINPFHMANILKPVLRDPTALYGNKLIAWYDDLRRLPNGQLVSALYPACVNGPRQCSVYSKITSTLCKRKACRFGEQRCMCWQHKFQSMNKPSGNKKCNANHVQCH